MSGSGCSLTVELPKTWTGALLPNSRPRHFCFSLLRGPIMAIVARNTLRHGMATGLSIAIGVELGEVCLLGAMFAGSSLSGELLPVLFRWLSLAEALYLVWLATGALRLRRRFLRGPNLSRARAPLPDGLMIAFANPAALMFS